MINKRQQISLTITTETNNNNDDNNNNKVQEPLSPTKIVRIKSPVPSINMNDDTKGSELKMEDLTSEKTKSDSSNSGGDNNNTNNNNNNNNNNNDGIEKKSSRAAVVPTDVAKNNSKKKFSLKTVAKTAVVGKKMAKTFKTFRSSNHLDSSAKKIKLKANPILKRDPNMTDEEAEADALVRTVIKTRRMKKILQAKLDSLRVQENIQFALEHNLDAGELNMARADIITACTRLTEPFEIETGPLVNALKKVRTLQQDIQFIEDLESGGFRNVVEMLDSQLNDLIDEKNNKQYQIEYAHKIMHELEEDEEAAEELIQTNLLNAKKTEHGDQGGSESFLTIMRAAKQKKKQEAEMATKEDDSDEAIENKLDDEEDYKIVTPISKKPSRKTLAGLT